jgi:hypothetical protein
MFMAEPEKPSAVEVKEKIFEVVRPIKIGRGEKPGRREVGASVKASELGPGEVESLLKNAILIDSEAPITGASSQLAHDRLISIAEKLGVVSRKGGDYSFGARKFKGLAAFRAGATLDELEAAIVAAAKSE